MKRVRPDAIAIQLQPPRNPRLAQQCRTLLDTTSIQHSQRRTAHLTLNHHHHHHHLEHRTVHTPVCWTQARSLSTSRQRSVGVGAEQAVHPESSQAPPIPTRPSHQSRLRSVPARNQGQPPSTSRQSSEDGSIARLSALHARLSLPPEFALHTLARCLIDASADPHPARNNASLAVLGQDLLAYYTSEHLMVNFPRLPVPIIFAAQYAYSGSATLATMRTEWGVELAAAPGPEVNRALLQFKRMTPGNALAQDGISQIKDTPSLRKIGSGRDAANYRRGMSSRIALDDEFGDLRPDVKPYPGAILSSSKGHDSSASNQPVAASGQDVEGEAGSVTAETASATFVRALVGAISMHCGDNAAKQFHQDHILSRHLQLHKLFDFKQPTFDLSRLCAREDFDPPIARLLSETGRHTRCPVYVVGVFSGEDKLGEGAGSSLNEARTRAAAAALRAWYLYSPPIDRVMRPSEMESLSHTSKKSWIPQMIDLGEIVA